MLRFVELLSDLHRPVSDAAPRDRAALPHLGTFVPHGPVLLDTNVFINALAGRGPAVLQGLLDSLPRVFVAAPTRAELAWVQGRLDPAHPGTARVLAVYQDLLARIEPAKVLVPGDADWLQAGELAGRVARTLAGGGTRIATAFHRVELISDALTAILARSAGFTVVTEDAHFDLLAQLLPGLAVVFYDRPRRGRTTNLAIGAAGQGRAGQGLSVLGKRTACPIHLGVPSTEARQGVAAGRPPDLNGWPCSPGRSR